MAGEAPERLQDRAAAGVGRDSPRDLPVHLDPVRAERLAALDCPIGRRQIVERDSDAPLARPANRAGEHVERLDALDLDEIDNDARRVERRLFDRAPQNIQTVRVDDQQSRVDVDEQPALRRQAAG